MQTQLRGVAAGVPYVAVPPEGGPRGDAPTVVAWHLMDAPRTEAAFAAALPLSGLDAWRVYLGLPLTGARLPEGGVDERMRLGYADAVLNLHGPVSQKAVQEFEPALAELRGRLGLAEGPVAVLGGSIGSAVAQLVLTESAVPVAAGVLVSPVAQIRPVVEALSQQFGVTYAWSAAAEAVARRLDFVARAGEFSSRGEPAVLLVVGEDDDADGFLAPVERLRDALHHRYADPAQVDLVTVPGMAHALAEEPGIDPAPQTAAAGQVDALAVGWLRRHLSPAVQRG